MNGNLPPGLPSNPLEPNLEAISPKTSSEPPLKSDKSTHDAVTHLLKKGMERTSSPLSRAIPTKAMPQADDPVDATPMILKGQLPKLHKEAVPKIREEVIETIVEGLSPQEQKDLKESIREKAPDLDTLHQIAELIDGELGASDRGYVINTMMATPKEERATVSKLCKELLTVISDKSSFDEVIVQLGQIPVDQRESCVHEAVRALKGLKNLDVFNALSMVTTLKTIPQEMHSTVVDRGEGFFDKTMTADDRANVLTALAKLPKGSGDSLLQLARPFLLEMDSASTLCQMLEILSTIPQENQLERAGQFIDKLQAKTPDERNEVITLASNMALTAKVVETLVELPQDKRASVGEFCQKVTSLVLNKDVEAIHSLLVALSQLPVDEQNDIMNRLDVRRFEYRESIPTDTHIYFSRYPGIDIPQIEQVVRQVAAIPLVERENLFSVHKANLAVLGDVSQLGEYLAIFAGTGLSSEQRTTAIERLSEMELDIQNFQNQMRYARGEPPIEEAALPAYRGEEDLYYVYISRDDLKTRPELVLHNLSELFSHPSARELRVNFIGEQGSDVEGLSKEFISLVADGMREKLAFRALENGLYTPTLRVVNGEYQRLNEDEIKNYKELGQLMMYCLNITEASYVIGMIFDERVFTALTKFKDAHLDRDFEEMLKDPQAVNELFEIFAAMNGPPQQQAKRISYMRNFLAALSDEDKKDFINDQLRPALAPLVEIAKGMKNAQFQSTFHWADLQKLSAGELSQRLQGVVDTQTIVNALSFGEGISKEQQDWITKWLLASDKDTVVKFLSAITGSRALGKKGIKIEPVIGLPQLHTCFNKFDLPLSDNEAALIATIERAIEGEGYDIA